MLTIGLGDIATRIVRSLRVRGRVPTALDEQIIPTVRLMDLADPFFAQNPATWEITVGQAGGAGVAPFVLVSNRNAPNLTVIIDEYQVTNNGTLADTVNGVLRRGQVGGAGNSRSIVLNQPAPQNVIDGATWQVGTNLAAGGDPIWFQNLPTLQGTGVIPCGAVLYPGDSFAWVSGTAAATALIQVTAWGRTFLGG